jgi:hypothetical protein
VAHQDDSFGAILACVFDGGKGADNALVVCDLLVAVEGDIEVDLEVESLGYGIEQDVVDGLLDILG